MPSDQRAALRRAGPVELVVPEVHDHHVGPVAGDLLDDPARLPAADARHGRVHDLDGAIRPRRRQAFLEESREGELGAERKAEGGRLADDEDAESVRRLVLSEGHRRVLALQHGDPVGPDDRVETAAGRLGSASLPPASWRLKAGSRSATSHTASSASVTPSTPASAQQPPPHRAGSDAAPAAGRPRAPGATAPRTTMTASSETAAPMRRLSGR